MTDRENQTTNDLKSNEQIAQDATQRTFNGADTYDPLSSFLCEVHGLHVSAVFGKIWNLSQAIGYSFASNGTMAKKLGIDPHTVAKAIKILLNLKLITDVTEKYKESHEKQFGKSKKKLPQHKQVRFYQPDAKMLAKLKKEYYE